MIKHWLRIFFLLASSSLYALTILNVTLDSDNNPGGMGDVGDLRYYLNVMNRDLNNTYDNYAITFAHPMTIQLNGILPLINNSANPANITIGNSDPSSRVIIDGNSGAYSGFFIPTGNVTIQNMTFQNLTARGGNGGDGIAGGGGGMGAGGAIYAPQTFLNGSTPSITLMNVLIQNCSAEGGNGGSYSTLSFTGNEGGGGGGGFSGNGGSIIIAGRTGGAGGGGFGGDGGNVTISADDPSGGGGGGGGGLGSRATLGMLTNLGNGGADSEPGMDGSAYGLSIQAGVGGGGWNGGLNAGGGGGGGVAPGGSFSGGGGGGSAGSEGLSPQGNTPPLHGESATPSGGNGGDGAGGGGAGVVVTSFTMNGIDGKAGFGGYGGGGGGGAGVGAYAIDYTVQAGTGGVGGGGGGGGVDQSGQTSAQGGDSQGGGGGGGGGPSNGSIALGGTDVGGLGGGAGGAGATIYGAGLGGGGGGGGSGLGGAIFVDSGLNFTIQALSGVPTTFNTLNTTVGAGAPGAGGPGGDGGFPGSALGNSIFLRADSRLTFMAQDSNDLLTLGDRVAFTDDTDFGKGNTAVFVTGNGTVIYTGTTNYQGNVTVNNANFKVNGLINNASVSVCRNIGLSAQRGTLSGSGTLTGNVSVNSGSISPDVGETLNLGSLTLHSAATDALGSLVHIDINSDGASSVAVAGSLSLAGILEINLDSSAVAGQYTLLTSSGITGTFDSITFTGATPTYTLSYLPLGAPTYVQLNFLGYPAIVTPSGVNATTTPSTPQTVDYNAMQSFTVTAETGYILDSVVGGTCPAGSWAGSVYTTGAITSNCTVSFSATLSTYTVTPGGVNVSTTPSTPQTVNYNATQSFNVTAETGYILDSVVGGTCPAGSWAGGVYTTGAITNNCTVSFSATLSTYTVTPGGVNVTTTPSTPQTVNYNATQSFTVTAETGYILDSVVGGTCPAGSWDEGVYTTGAITSNCTVSFSATLSRYTVTPGGVNVTTTPSGSQAVNYNATQNFAVTADTGYTLDSTIGGTCPAGSWSGSVYTTGPILENCTVSFSATIDIPATVNGSSIWNPAVVCCGRPVILGPLPVPGTGPTIYTVINQTGHVSCRIGRSLSQTYLKMHGKNGSCTIIGTKDGVTSTPLTVIAP